MANPINTDRYQGLDAQRISREAINLIRAYEGGHSWLTLADHLAYLAEMYRRERPQRP